MWFVYLSVCLFIYYFKMRFHVAQANPELTV